MYNNTDLGQAFIATMGAELGRMLTAEYGAPWFGAGRELTPQELEMIVSETTGVMCKNVGALAVRYAMQDDTGAMRPEGYQLILGCIAASQAGGANVS